MSWSGSWNKGQWSSALRRIAEKERALVPQFAQSLATLQQSASAATDQLQTETGAAVEAMSESIASLMDDCERLLRSVGEGLASAITAQKDFAFREFGLREARQRKANARESRSRLQKFREPFERELEGRHR
jgi:hypothetical protein